MLGHCESIQCPAYPPHPSSYTPYSPPTPHTPSSLPYPPTSPPPSEGLEGLQALPPLLQGTLEQALGYLHTGLASSSLKVPKYLQN